MGQMDNQKEIRIFGPPGTGKTTTLSGLIASACRDYGSEAVLVSSFTRAAARELVSRDLPLSEDRIGTLHALCYRALERPKLVSKELLKDWNAEHPFMAFDGCGTNLDDPYGDIEASVAKEGDKLLQEYNRLRGLQIEQGEWPYTIQHFAEAWQDFKNNTFTVDFTDLIERCVDEAIPIPHEAQVFFLDEVQDFSPLELKLARNWSASCERVYLAGDDDQCLYAFKGATPHAFLSPELPADQVRILSQSYRIPRAVHEAATAWVEQMTTRMPKAYRPKDMDGEVGCISGNYKYLMGLKGELDEWLDAGKTVAFLASCSFFIDPVKHQLREWGIPFWNPYRKTRGDWNPLTGRAGTVSAADRLLSFRRVKDHQTWWTYKELWDWAATLEAERLFVRGAKTEIRRMAENDTTAGLSVAAEDLDRWMPGEDAARAATDGDLDWWQSKILNAYEKPISYACRVLEERGVSALQRNPQVIIGTIHSVKGGEADIVVLFPDLSPAGSQEWWAGGEAQDSVRRMFYVGMTRAKESLYWAQPAGPGIGGY